MRKVIAAVAVAAGLGAWSLAGGESAVCVCRARTMPQWAAWADTHQSWACTVVVPRDGSVTAPGCTVVNAGGPAGFAVTP